MNILLINPRSYASYYSFVELYCGRGKRATSPPLGLLTVAGLLPRDWTLRLVDENLDDVTGADYAFADSVFIGAMLPQRDFALELVRAAKAKGKHVVCGGPLAFSLPDDLLAAGCDILVRGEAEGLRQELVDAVRERRTGLVLQAEAKPDLVDAPLPRFDLADLPRYLAMAVQTTRGCPHNCEFCDVVNLNGRTPRSKDPAQVVAELDQLYRLGWRKAVFISDDNFIGDRQYARRVLAAMKEWSDAHGTPFHFAAQSSIELAKDPELIGLMTDANFMELFIGVETTDEDVLLRNSKNHNVKNPLAQSLRIIAESGINLQCSFVVGFDGEKPGVGKKIVEFARDNALPQIIMNILVGFPGTRLWKRLEAEGRVRHPWLSQDCFYGVDSNIRLERPASEVGREFVYALEQLYEPAAFQQRAFEAIMRMPPTRAAQARAAAGEPPAVPSLRTLAWPLKLLLAGYLLRQGVFSSRRGEFWRQYNAVRRGNPSRFRRYLDLLMRGEMITAFVKAVQRRVRELEQGGSRG